MNRLGFKKDIKMQKNVQILLTLAGESGKFAPHTDNKKLKTNENKNTTTNGCAKRSEHRYGDGTNGLFR